MNFWYVALCLVIGGLLSGISTEWCERIETPCERMAIQEKYWPYTDTYIWNPITHERIP